MVLPVRNKGLKATPVGATDLARQIEDVLLRIAIKGLYITQTKSISYMLENLNWPRDNHLYFFEAPAITSGPKI
jgi:hypothetical protein